MSSLQNRPFSGTWVQNRTNVQYATDCIVMINGFTEFAACVSCNKMLDLQKYITNVSVDASTESISTANFTITIPSGAADVFSRDGNHILQPNLEVVVLMRGYFPLKNYAGQGQETEDGFDANNVPVYPYYQVFRGVTTEVSHEFSGGFHTSTVQCSNLLHFWQYLKLSVNGSVFGQRPTGSMVNPEIGTGHKFTNANPYSIIYTLVKVGFGAAFGVDFQLGQSSNVAAVDDTGRTSMYAHAASWWAKRWTEHSGNLRMYGIDGSIFNAFEQAYLGRWVDTRKDSIQVTNKKVYTAITGAYDRDINRHGARLKKLRENNWNASATSAGLYKEGAGYATEDVIRMQAFCLDIGKMGAANMFETEYMSKQEIAEAVKTITGFEFYQDVDGDLVFKPPMYNLDTSSDPVFCISDRDLISFSETESEPEATLMKGTGSHFSNITGTGIDGWLGVGGVFIDYRLVAKYGYREETFESNYFSSKHALFVSAMNRLDLANAGTKACSITIPLRPELRPGYPVYIESEDCFYYVKSLSHAFAFGGSCQTTIQGVAKRSKFLPPMQTAGDAQLPTIGNVRLDAPDEFPSQPLIAYPERWTGGSASAGPPRIYGFPNVILALDPSKVNMATVDVNLSILSAQGYVEMALAEDILQRMPEQPDTFLLRSGNLAGTPITLATIQQEWASASAAIAAGEYTPVLSEAFGQIISDLAKRKGGNIDIPEAANLINYLALQTSLKGMFAPGAGVTGKYRYYSCNHPDEEDQGPSNLAVDNVAGTITEGGKHPGAPGDGSTKTALVIQDVGAGLGVCRTVQPIKKGVEISDLSQTATGSSDLVSRVISTADVRFVTFGPQKVKKSFDLSIVGSGKGLGSNLPMNEKGTKQSFEYLLTENSLSDPSLTIAEIFNDEYNRILACISDLSTSFGVGGVSAVTRALAQYSTVTAALTTLRFPNAPTQTVSAAFNKKLPADALSMVVGLLGKGLWVYLAAVLKEGKKLVTKANADTFMGYRATFLWSYTGGQVTIPDANPAEAKLFTQYDGDTVSMTPIFPVSDNKGYEVYGNLPYGRGLTVEKYALLFAPFTGDDGEDTPEPDAEGLIGTRSGSNAGSMAAVEAFFQVFLDGDPSTVGDAQEVLMTLSESHQAALLAFLNTDVNGFNTAVETLFTQDSAASAKIRNTPVTSFYRGQAVYQDTAARNLSSLDLQPATCSCKGAEAQFFLMAFSEESLQKYGDDPVQGFIEEQTALTGAVWRDAKNAMSGEVMDTRTANLAAELTSDGTTARTYTNLARGAVQDVGQVIPPRR